MQSSQPSQTVLVAGGTGFLGAAFVRALADRGHRPVVLSRSPEKVSSRFPGREVEARSGDVTRPETLRPVSIETAPFPGFATDLQAQWTVLLGLADGTATVTDTIYDDRFKHVPELQRLGLEVEVDGNTATVHGGAPLKGAKVMSTDLRAGVSLVMAGMLADGRTDVLRVYHLDRGYEALEDKLRDAGIAIHREAYDEFAEPDRAPAEK